MNPKNILYHYCRLDSLRMIVQSKELHFSCLKNSNDPSEIVSAKEYIYKKLLKEKFGYEPELIVDQSEFFAFSLSREDDLLSQWRGYADDCKGVMLGICIDRLKYTCYSENYNPQHSHNYDVDKNIFGSPCFEHREIIYEEDKLRNSFEGISSGFNLERHFNYYKENNKFLGEFYTEELSFFLKMHWLSAFYKKSFWKEEAEERCLIVSPEGDPPIKLRNQSLKVRKFVRADFKQVIAIPFINGPHSPLVSVMLGPANNISHSTVRQLLNDNGYNDVHICNSAGAYRPK